MKYLPTWQAEQGPGQEVMHEQEQHGIFLVLALLW